MRVKRVLSAVIVAVAMLHGGHTSAAADYPPAGAVIVITGELIVGEIVEVTVHNCSIGEEVRTELETTTSVQSVCVSGVSRFAETAAAAGRRQGVSEYELSLPDEPGVVAGQVELLGSDQTLTFFLDVRAPAPEAEAEVVVLEPRSSGMPGWPFLLLAALIVLLMLVFIARRSREPEIP